MTEREKILPVRAEMAPRRRRLVRAIVAAESLVAHPAFFLLLVATHGAWVLLNSGWVPGIAPWDGYPFPLLAAIASVEAPLITTLVLMRQHRDRRVAEAREELGLALALRTQRQAALLLRLTARLRDRLEVARDEDAESLNELAPDLDPEELLRETLRRLDRVEGTTPEEQ